MSRAASPMRGGYLVTNPLLYGVLRSTDWLLEHVISRSQSVTGAPSRVLIAVGGHRGDAVIATAAIAAVRRLLPNAKLGVVSGSWSASVFGEQQDVQWQHTMDHWAITRSPAGTYGRATRHVRSARAALRDLRSVGYDYAIDLYPFYPNMGALFWRAGIPQRVGFASGGRSAFFTRVHAWVDDRRHVAEKQVELVEWALGEGRGESGEGRERPRCQIAEPRREMRESAEAKLRSAQVEGEFIVVHAGGGSRVKEWPIEKWRTVVASLTGRATSVVLTGTGDDERRAAEHIAEGFHHCANLVGQLEWQEFVHVLSRAQGVVSVDTVAGHVAGAVGTPAVVLFAGINDLREWQPLGEHVVSLINQVSCAPCFQGAGCATMDCIRGIDPELVLRQLDSMVRLTP